MQCFVEIEVRNVYSKIIGDLPDPVIDALDLELSYYIEGYQYSKLFTTGYFDKKENKWKYWDGRKKLFYAGHGFNTGLLFRVTQILKAFSISANINDKRNMVKFGPELVGSNKYEEREYQKTTVDTAIACGGGIIKIATGGGKSIVMGKLIAKTNLKTMIFVPGLDLLYQTQSVIEDIIGQKVGIIGDGNVDIRNITISTIWSAANALSKKLVKFDEEFGTKKEKFNIKEKKNIAEAIRNVDMFLVDECHMASCMCVGVINSAAKNCRHKYGFSGTPQKGSGEDLIIEGIFGKKIVDIPASLLIEQGYLVKPIIYFINAPGEAVTGNYHAIYKKYIVENEDRNNKIITMFNKLKDAGRKTLILVKNIKHGEILMEKFDKNTIVYFVRGEVEAEERKRIRKEFIAGKIDVIVASSVFDIGVDLPNLDALILAGSGKSSIRSLQRIGRVIRPYPGKNNAIILDFIDPCKYLFDHSLARKNVYEREPGFEIKMPKNKAEIKPVRKSAKNNTKQKDFGKW